MVKKQITGDEIKRIIEKKRSIFKINVHRYLRNDQKCRSTR